jgi:hypothetical protein
MLLRPALAGIMWLVLSSVGLTQTHASTVPRDPITRLREGFRNPPPQARLRCYWWWLNGNTDEPTITRDLEQMKAKGYGGAILVDAGGATQNGNNPVPAGPLFGSPAWVKLYTHALREADRLGLEITLNIMSGWNLGGPTVTPEDASKILTFATLDLDGGAPQQVTLPEPAHDPRFYRQIAVLAYPLRHGRALAPQHNDGQGDRHTAAEQPTDDSYSPAIRFRAAAAESGFSMNDSSSMLDDGLSSDFASNPSYADASLSEVRVLAYSSGRTLQVDLPSGLWEIFVVGYTITGATVSTSSDTWNGLAIDHLSRQAFNHYWDQNVEPLLSAARPFHSLKYLATDSWELGGTNWTSNFRQQFLARRGYDPIPYLSILAGRILDNRSVTTRFLTDLRRTVADLIAANHYDLFTQRAAQHGLGVQAESGGPHGAPIDALDTFRHSTVPQTEFWAKNPHRGEDPERFFTKEAASAANIYGRRFVAQEGETSIGPQWSESIATDLKPAFDMGITEGMNRLVWHEFTSSPISAGLPGQEYFAGTHLNPNVTWWNDGKPFFDYLNRVQFLMQQGHAVNDVLYFYGDHVPNFVRLKADDPAHVLPGYDYDVTNQDALIHSIHIDRQFLKGPGGVTWRVLTLPKTRRVSISVLQIVEHYLQSGGTVVSLPPESTTGNISAEQRKTFRELVERIWNHCDGGSHSYGNGRVYCTQDTHAALKEMKILPDIEIVSSDVRLAPASSDAIDGVHRRIGNTDIYFLRSAYPATKSFPVTLRAKGLAELWDPVTGIVYRAAQKVVSGRTEIEMTLPAYGSMAVVFVPQTAAPTAPQLVRKETAVGSWSLTFPGQREVALRSLESWTRMEGKQYFSGTATYHGVISPPRLVQGEHACLHFASIHEIAVVDLDGADPSTLWTFPYQVCLRSRLERPLNLSVKVTNLWHNRLVGDAQPGAVHTAKTNIVLPSPRQSMMPSGILGPAEWWIYKSESP